MPLKTCAALFCGKSRNLGNFQGFQGFLGSLASSITLMTNFVNFGHFHESSATILLIVEN